jgi:hypothetical protein
MNVNWPDPMPEGGRLSEQEVHLSHAGAYGDMQGFERHVHRLGIAHRQALEESRWPNTGKQIWINVIGFSRGAAAARAFVHKLVNEWAPGV